MNVACFDSNLIDSSTIIVSSIVLLSAICTWGQRYHGVCSGLPVTGTLNASRVCDSATPIHGISTLPGLFLCEPDRGDALRISFLVGECSQ